jgi:DNA-binding PadR family transcriptional regulator
MAKGSANFRYFILGLLFKRAMSGYDIRRFLKSLGWLLGNPSFSVIYPALHALLKDDLVSVEVVPHPSRPARKIYTITEVGKRALQEWIAQPPPSSIGIRAFIMHLILAGDSSRAGLVAHLQRRREVTAAQHSALEQAVKELGEQASLGEHMAIEYGLRIASAEMAWLEDKLAQLSTDSEMDPSEKTT